MPEKFARIDSQNTRFGDNTYNKSYTVNTSSEGVHYHPLRKNEVYNYNPSSPPEPAAQLTSQGNHWAYIHNLLYRSGSSTNNADEMDKFNSIYHQFGQFDQSKPLYNNKFYDSGSVFYIPQNNIGERIQPGTFQIVACTSSYDTTAKQILIQDDGYGNLYPTNAHNSQSNTSAISSSENYVGNVFYDLGIAVLTETASWSGSINYTDIGTVDYPYWSLKYNATLPIYTGEYSIVVKAGDFNTTINESARGEASGSDRTGLMNLKDNLTGSGWSPYFNQVQLFRNQLEEPALIANLPRAVKTRDDIDIIITFRLDR